MTTAVSENSAGEIAAGNTDQPAHWSGVFAMTLCVFALIASEFMPVSLLTPIASTLNVSEGLAGYGIAISGAFAVITSLSISSLAGTMNRKTLLLILTALMGASGLVVGLASNYIVYMIGRAMIGVVIGGFWSMSAAVAMRLVPSESVPRALAIFNGGNALATVVAAPLGSYLGGVIGWRGAFFCLVPIAVLAFVWQWISLPSMKAQPRAKGSANVFTLFSNPPVAFGMLAVALFFMGQFELFTYVRPFLEGVTGVDVSTLSMMLLVLGIAGFVGTLIVGNALKHGLYGTLVVIPVLMALIAMGLVSFGTSAMAVFVLLGLWGLVATAAPVGWWSWLAQTLPNDAEAGGGLMVAVIQLSIAFGSTLGGVLYDGSGYKATFIVAGALLVVSALVTVVASRVSQARAT
ncbi:MFS transporter [Pseudomonas aeruginosa]|uniref:MFS transporter n=1 Tax=Pseudomonas aeruginosa TaxID=287 RepID=UPI00101381A7|nr:MFS transporter [Pseudomonas aeruginosa]MCK1186394.1 MFS transporter [Pseudomonas aeruginosa]HBN9511469.1 MFS transporter [Pseudomonas aeruginosa]HBN9782204.1 MFS transporter [Pseudomonas aeruginosa]HBN9851855.1 MFS transporter [Pseudomonas aeruginosa]HBN9865263.1 MFS transporter [Pseudomonas aeruginosa]